MDELADPARPSVAGSLRGLALACHPIPTAGVSVLSVLLAAGLGLSAARVTLIGLAVLTGQLSIGWSNDRIDAHRDAVTARTDKPAATGEVAPSLVGWAAIAALAATIALSLVVGGLAAAALLTLVAAGWVYNLGAKATPFSGLAYVIGFGALPAAPYLAQPGHPWPPWWVPVTGALLGLGAHFANVLPDLRDDAATGVRGLPHRLGRQASTIALAATLGAASVILGFGPSRSVTLAIAASALGLLGATAVAVLASRTPDSPAAFRVTIGLALLDVILVVALAR